MYLGKKQHKNVRAALRQRERPLPTEIDDEPELIDLSSLITHAQDAEIPKLNERIIIEQPVKWWIDESGNSVKMYEDGRLDGDLKATSEYHALCCLFSRDTSRLWKSSIGERVRPTQIISLLTQNPTGGTRSPHFCYKWDQTDEAFYRAKAKEGLAEFIADTRPNYFCVPHVSTYRHLFKCPDLEKIIAAISAARDGSVEPELDDDPGYDDDNVDYGCDHFELPPPDVQQGDILIHVDPKTGQATYVCPRCTYNNKKIFGGTGYPVKHPIGRDVRQKLSDAGIIPAKEYKNKDRTVEVDAIINLVDKTPRGIGYYKIDQAFAWPKGTAKRLVEKHLKDRVVVRVKDGKTKVCPIKNRYA